MVLHDAETSLSADFVAGGPGYRPTNRLAVRHERRSELRECVGRDLLGLEGPRVQVPSGELSVRPVATGAVEARDRPLEPPGKSSVQPRCKCAGRKKDEP